MAASRCLIVEQNKVVLKCIERLRNAKTYNNEEIFKTEVNGVFDTLNALEYNINFIKDKNAEDFLQLCMEILPKNNDHLLSKWCHLIVNLIIRQQVNLQTTVLQSTFEYIIKKITSSGVWALPDLLKVLSVLLHDNGSKLEKFWEKLVGKNGILLHFSLPSYPDKDISHIALKCLQNLLVRKPNEAYLNEDLLINCFSTLFTCLKTYMAVPVDDVNYCKMIVTLLKGMQNLLLGWKIIPVGQLGILLGLLKFYMFHGQPGQSSLTSVCLYPSAGSQFMTASHDNQSSYPKLLPQKRRNRRKTKVSKKGNKGKREQQEDDDDLSEGTASDSSYANCQKFSHSQSDSVWKPHLTPLWLTSSSDSEYSDTDVNQMTRVRSVQSLVRQHAFSTLQTVIRVTDKKSMFGYWLSFLPDTPSVSGPQPQTILVSILKDPSPQVRTTAISVLTDLLDCSKQFLMVADESVVVRTAFIPLSTTLGALVRELHRCLLLALVAENSSFILIQLLKCYAVLVNNVPYHRFHPDLLIRLIKHLYPLLHHKDSQVQTACLTVMGSIVCIQPIPKEIAVLLKDSSYNLEKIEQNTSKLLWKEMNSLKLEKQVGNVPWLVRKCQENILAKDKVPLPVQLESLQVLGLFVKAYFDVMRDYLDVLKDLIIICLEDTNSFLQLHGAKLLEATGISIYNATKDIAIDHCFSLEKEEILHFWEQLLIGPLPVCLQNDEHNTLRSICCNCVSTITADIFATLPKNLQTLCITLMLGLAREDDPNVKGAAIRCLGIYTLFPCLREDIAFLIDSGQVIIDAVKDEHFGVRSKASWSLGNLSYALLLSRDEWPDFYSEVPDSFLYSLGIAAIHASNDRDNIPANAVRTIGNLLFYLTQESLKKEQVKSMVLESIHALLSNLKTRFVKVRWNSCYALGKVLQNSILLESSFIPVDEIFMALIHTLKDGTNFKVCINAAASLSSITVRKLYGSHFVAVWCRLTLSLSNSYDHVDFRELKHQNNLCNQLCASLCHLMTLLQVGDLLDISDITLKSSEILFTSMNKFIHADKDESKCRIVERAINRLEDLVLLPNMTIEAEVQSLLKEILCTALTPIDKQMSCALADSLQLPLKPEKLENRDLMSNNQIL